MKRFDIEGASELLRCFTNEDLAALVGGNYEEVGVDSVEAEGEEEGEEG